MFVEGMRVRSVGVHGDGGVCVFVFRNSFTIGFGRCGLMWMWMLVCVGVRVLIFTVQSGLHYLQRHNIFN